MTKLSKAVLPALVDPDHKYVFRTGEMGIYDYWYRDRVGNYWRYNNAPEGHKDYDPSVGSPLFDSTQPIPTKFPQFFSPEGFKRHLAVPNGTIVTSNPEYNPVDPENVWFESYEAPSGIQYIYKDADVRENLDLFVPFQLRIADAGLIKYRTLAVTFFNGNHPRNKAIGAMMMLSDQAGIPFEELSDTKVSKLHVVGGTVQICGRKVVCDEPLLDYLTSLRRGAQEGSISDDLLFITPTAHGISGITFRMYHSILHYIRVSPRFIRALHFTMEYSKSVHKHQYEGADPDQIDDLAIADVKQVFQDAHPHYLIDARTRKTLLEAVRTPSQEFGKSLTIPSYNRSWVTRIVRSNLVDKLPDEQSFSQWLHAQPLHFVGQSSEGTEQPEGEV